MILRLSIGLEFRILDRRHLGQLLIENVAYTTQVLRRVPETLWQIYLAEQAQLFQKKEDITETLEAAQISKDQLDKLQM